MAVLTEDVLTNVFRCLPTRSDRTAASLVCKRWLKVFCDARKTCHLWRAEVVPALTKRCPNLTDIDCSGTIHVSHLALSCHLLLPYAKLCLGWSAHR